MFEFDSFWVLQITQFITRQKHFTTLKDGWNGGVVLDEGEVVDHQ